MKRKQALLYLIPVLLSIGIGFAETGQNLQEQFDTVKQMNYLNQVGVYFMNEKTQATPKDYSINIQQGESKELNLLLKNESDKKLNVRIKFTDQVTKDGKTQGCGTEYTDGFAKFVSAPRKGDIAIPAKSQINKRFEIKFPVGIEGIQKGCIAYGVTEDTQKNQRSILSVITRKILYLDALIGGTGDINYKIALGETTAVADGKGELLAGIVVQNIGNVDSTIDIQGNISNIFGFDRPITTSGTIRQNETTTLTTNVRQLPSYGGIFEIRLQIKDKPDFGFDGKKFGIDPKIVAGGERTITIRYFARHRRMVITLLALIAIIYRAQKKLN